MMKNTLSITTLTVLFTLTFAYPTVTLANGTVTNAQLPAKKNKNKATPSHYPQPSECPQEEICPIACPCPPGWQGGALEPDCTPPFIESCDVTCCFTDGIYIGGQVGYIRPHHKYHVTLNGMTSGTFHGGRTQDTVTGGVLIGGRYFFCPQDLPGIEFLYPLLAKLPCHQFFLGAELSINKDASSTRFFISGNAGDSYMHKVKRQYSVIPTAVFGAAFVQTFALYVKLGVDIARYRNTIFTVDDGGTNSSFIVHKSQTVLLPALGIEYCFSPSISTRIEVSHNFHTRDMTMDVTTNAGNRDRRKVKPRNTVINVGILYKFNMEQWG
jgi:opacity protein-like surface antigen